VATQTGDLQTKKEIEVFLRRLDSAPDNPSPPSGERAG